MVKLAENRGVQTGVQYNIRFYPLNIEAKNRASKFERIYGISGGYTQDWLMYDTDYNWRVLKDRTSVVNCVGDIGTHYLHIGQRNEPNRFLIKNPANQVAEAAYFTGYPTGHMEGFPDSHKMCFKAFYDEFVGKNPPVKMPTLEEGHREICICEAIVESNEKQAWVDVKY